MTTRYKTVPPLDPFPIYECQLDPGLPALNLSGYLPRLPDQVDGRDGYIPDRADLWLGFHDLAELTLSGIPDRDGGELVIRRLDKERTEFEYSSNSFCFRGVCGVAVVGSLSISSNLDPEHPRTRGKRLLSHSNVWNSCLVLLKEYGYELRATGSLSHRDYPTRLRWNASSDDGASLSADTPIELLGLAALHRHQDPQANGDYWWRLDGPPLVKDLVESWEASLDPLNRDSAT